MPIRTLENVTLKHWHLHTNILVIFTLLPFIVVITELVTLKELYLVMTIFIFSATVPNFCLQSCKCNTLILDVYECVGVPLA